MKMQTKAVLCFSSIVVITVSSYFLLANNQQKQSAASEPILFISKSSTSDYHRMVLLGVQQRAKQYSVEVEVYEPKLESDYMGQIGVIESIVSQSGKPYSGIIIEPNHAILLGDPLKRIGSRGYKYVVVDSPITSLAKGEAGYCGYVGSDNYHGGWVAADYLVNKIVKGNVVIVHGIRTHQTSLDRAAGFLDRIQENSKLQVLSHVDGEWDGNATLANYNVFIKDNHSKIDAVFALSDPMALAVAQAHSNESTRPMIVGYNGDKEAQAALLNEKIDATITQAPELMGQWAVDLLFNCSQDGNARTLETPVSLMTVSKVISTQKVSRRVNEK